jgi:fibronectin type 3 domain-containing protein
MPIIDRMCWISKLRAIFLAVAASSLVYLSACAGVSSSSKAASGQPATGQPPTGQSPAPGQSAPYSVSLSWNASSSSVIGYNLYRGTQSGGPYAKVNPSVLSNTNYTDSSIQSGTTYYYVSTSINGENEESAYSNQASAAIP